MFTDSHCHLASRQFSQEEIPALIQRAEANGIHRMISVSTSLEDIPINLDLAKTYPQIHATIGIHPCNVHETPDDYLPAIKNYISESDCCAIGETGLDYFHPAPDGWSDHDYYARQREFLHQHFQLAAEFGKNIIIHTRDKSGHASLDDAVEIYSQYATDVAAVFHCFLGPWENPNVKTILDLGGYLSYTGITTFKNAIATLDAANRTPSDRIMLETDSPYLAPVPHRGQRNEPSYTIHTATTIADTKQINLEELAAFTEQNVNEFFKLK